MAYGTVNADVIGTSVAGYNLGAGNASSFKNRIINGDMRIDQRRDGSAVTPTASAYIVDRWQFQCTQASKIILEQENNASSGPVGFQNYLEIRSLSAYSVLTSDFFALKQSIEGFNTADLQWGTAKAKTVTLSFWVNCTLTGTFGGSITNSGNTRSYPFNYTISSANTWEQKSITIAGDTTGTWVGATNGTGLNLFLGLGAGSTYSGTAGAWSAGNYVSATGATSLVGTNNAVLYITGVQLEVGESATGFDYRPYGTELALCQRYYQKMSTNARVMSNGYNLTATSGRYTKPFIVAMRTEPTALETTGTASDYRILHAGTATVCNAVPAFNGASKYEIEFTGYVASGLTIGQGSGLAAAVSTDAFLAWSAEL